MAPKLPKITVPKLPKLPKLGPMPKLALPSFSRPRLAMASGSHSDDTDGAPW
jgi:hypothetical protein